MSENISLDKFIDCINLEKVKIKNDKEESLFAIVPFLLQFVIVLYKNDGSTRTELLNFKEIESLLYNKCSVFITEDNPCFDLSLSKLELN